MARPISRRRSSLLHAGLAFGAFHHFIYDPIKAGDLKHPFEHKLTLIKAGLAALYVYHELKLAANERQEQQALESARGAADSGGYQALRAEGLDHERRRQPRGHHQPELDLDQIKSTAASKGQSITESIPGASQLAAGL